jgi:disulfide bond formation protein DsbB
MRSLPIAAPVLVLSLLVIGGALFFQFVVGLVPCELCLLERWPWYAAILLSALALAALPKRAARAAALVFAALFLASSGIAAYHVAVEQHLIEGPTACTAPALTGGSVEDLLKRLKATPVVRCDEPQWELFGVSLAGWNLVASLALLGYCLFRAGRKR